MEQLKKVTLKDFEILISCISWCYSQQLCVWLTPQEKVCVKQTD